MTEWNVYHERGRNYVGTVESDTLISALDMAERVFGAPLKVERA